MTHSRPGHPDPVSAATENLAAAIAQMVAVSAATALAGHQCATARADGITPELLTYKQACQRLGISASTLYALLRTGAIRSVSLGPQVRRIPVAELDGYVAALLAAKDAPA